LSVESVATADDIVALQRAVRHIAVAEPVARYILRIAAASREDKRLDLGVSTRGALALYRAAQARALLANRDYVTPDDIQALAVPALAHRVLLTQRTRYGGVGTDTIVSNILEDVPIPT
jgi:MoxR-like ATPase